MDGEQSAQAPRPASPAGSPGGGAALPAPGVFTGVGIFYLLSAAAMPFTLTHPDRWGVVAATAVAGLGLMAFSRIVRRGRIEGLPLDAATALVGLALAIHGFLLPAFTGEFDDLAMSALVVAGTGFLLRSRRLLAAFLALALAAWAAAATWIHHVPVWGLEGALVFMAATLSVIAFTVRRRALRALAAAQAIGAREAEAARSGQERFRALAESARDAILVVDRAGRVSYLNPAARGLWGPGAGGARVGDLLTDGPAAAILKHVLEDPSAGAPAHPLELKARKADGSVVLVEASLAVTGPPADPVFTLIVRDITERKEAEKAEKEAVAQSAELESLRRMNTVKTQFLNTAAHELNTPITPIRLQLHMLRSGAFGALDPRQGKAVEILDRNVERLAVLVQEILDVARLESGRVKLEPRTLEMAGVLRETAEAFGETARQVGIQLLVEASPGLAVEADRNRLLQILYNLVSNALKFTPSGGRVTVRAEPQGDRALVVVHDTGLGMTPEQMGRLFQPFTQVHDTMKVTTPGTGLGLFICRGLVEAHGGSITVDSLGPGQGSIFRFTLPLSRAAAPAARAVPLPILIPVPVSGESPPGEEPLARRLRELI